MKITIAQLRQVIKEEIEAKSSVAEEYDLDESEKDKDGDGDSDFADIMMSRMMASGMPKSKAFKKTRKHDESAPKKAKR